jgi:hypothetical protein
MGLGIWDTKEGEKIMQDFSAKTRGKEADT